MKKLKAVLIIIGCLLCLFPKLILAQKDTVTVARLYQKAAKFVPAKPDSAKFYGNAAIDFAQKHQVITYSLAKVYEVLGVLSYRLAKYRDALSYFETDAKIATQLKNDGLLFFALNGTANIYIDLEKPDVALTYYQKCLKIAMALDNKKLIGQAYNNIAFVYKDQNKYDEAINYVFKSLEVNEAGGYKNATANNYLQLTVIYLRKGSNQQALKYGEQALKIFDDLHLNELVLTAHYLLSVGYEGLKDMARARNEVSEAVAIAKRINDQRSIAYNSIRLGDLFFTDGLYDEALASYKESLLLMQKINLQRNQDDTYIAIGKTLIKKGEFTESEDYLKKGLALAEASKKLENISLANKYLAELYHATGKDGLAMEYLKRHEANKDSLMSVQTSNKLAELQTKFETEKKQKQIEELNHQTALQALNLRNQNLQLTQSKLEIKQKKLQVDNQQLQLSSKQQQLNKSELEALAKGQKITLLNNQSEIQQLEISKRNTTIMIIAAIFVLVLIVGYLSYSRYKLKQEAILQAAVMNQQDIAAKGIIEAEERERKRIAAELHDGVGQLFTTVKMNMEILTERFLIKQPDADLLAEKTMAMVDESCAEVRSIAHQMMPNALIKSGLVSALRDFINKIPSEKLKISLETKGIDKGLESTTETVLYRVIQESVNNVIKHAEATALDILLLCDEKEITVSIEDNGKGFNTGDKGKFNGIGLKNMISRVEFLKGTVDISSSPGKGTLVAIFIPLNS